MSAQLCMCGETFVLFKADLSSSAILKYYSDTSVLKAKVCDLVPRYHVLRNTLQQCIKNGRSDDVQCL
jgi:hypothetical protein